MSLSQRWKISISALLMAGLLAACGGGDGGSAAQFRATEPRNLLQEPGAPAFTGNTADDGFDWINYRRKQVGVPETIRNGRINAAAQNHSEYQQFHNIITHEEEPGTTNYTGMDLPQRLSATGYFLTIPYAYGEVIAATSDTSGFFMAEELITAIYHRFVIFEPMFKESGTGAATSSAGTTYFTTNFASNNGYGPGIGVGKFVNYPFAGQSMVQTNFFSDQEEPDPVPDQNEVGYPISVHADIAGNLTVTSFTVRPRGGSNLAVRPLTADKDQHTPPSAAAIIPLSVLEANTVYDVSFTGQVDGRDVARDWSFKTR